MASRKKKPDLTEQQILSYILNGGDVEDLYDNTNVTVQQVVAAFVKRPEVLSSLREQAAEQAAPLESFNPGVAYADTFELQSDVNPITEKYRAMAAANPNAAAFAKRYFDVIAEQGNNPIIADRVSDQLRTIAESEYGLPMADAETLLGALDEDRDSWFREEQDLVRRRNAKNYSAFQKQREQLDLAPGETVAKKYFSQVTGLPELADLPDPSESFAQLASRRAKETFKLPAGDGPTQKRKQDATLTERKLYERAYLREIEKAGKAKSTPYKETVKKLLPQIVAKRVIEK